MILLTTTDHEKRYKKYWKYFNGKLKPAFFLNNMIKLLFDSKNATQSLLSELWKRNNRYEDFFP